MTAQNASTWLHNCLAVPPDLEVPTFGTPAWELCQDRRALVAATARAAVLWHRHGQGAAIPETRSPIRRWRDIEQANTPRATDHPGGSVPKWFDSDPDTDEVAA